VKVSLLQAYCLGKLTIIITIISIVASMVRPNFFLITLQMYHYMQPLVSTVRRFIQDPTQNFLYAKFMGKHNTYQLLKFKLENVVDDKPHMVAIKTTINSFYTVMYSLTRYDLTLDDDQLSSTLHTRIRIDINKQPGYVNPDITKSIDILSFITNEILQRHNYIKYYNQDVQILNIRYNSLTIHSPTKVSYADNINTLTQFKTDLENRIVDYVLFFCILEDYNKNKSYIVNKMESTENGIGVRRINMDNYLVELPDDIIYMFLSPTIDNMKKYYENIYIYKLNRFQETVNTQYHVVMNKLMLENKS
jgi:hypothetical protein